MTDLARPQGGGSYERQQDGSLKQIRKPTQPRPPEARAEPSEAEGPGTTEPKPNIEDQD